LIEQLAPGVELPRHGHLTASVTVDGDPNDLLVDADVSFDDEAGGSSRLFVEGGLAQGGLNVDDVRFRGLHLQLRPLQTDLLRALSPDLPFNGTIEGSALLTGSLQGGLQVNSDFVLRDARAGVSRVSADGSLLAAEAVRLQGLHVRFDPIQLDMLRQDVQGLPGGVAASGAVMLDGPIDGLVQVGADIAIDDPASGASRITGSGGVDFSETLRFQDLDLRADPLRAELIHAFSPEFPLGGVLEGSVSVSGSPSTYLDVTADVVHVEAGERSRVRGGGTLTVAPEAHVDLDLELQPLSLRTAGLFAPGARLRGEAEGELDVEGTLRDLGLRAALAFQDGGSLALVGRLESAGRDTIYALDLSVRAFDPSAVTDRLPLEASLEGTLQADGRGLDPATMEATLEADLRDVAVDAYESDGVQLQLHVDEGLATVSPARARLRSAVVELEGSFGIAPGRVGTLAYRLAVDSLHTLAPWIPAADTGIVAPRPAVGEAADVEHERAVREAEVAYLATGRLPDIERDTLAALYIPRDSLSGSLHVEGTASGYLDRFDVEGRAILDRLIYRGHHVGHGEIDYTLADAAATTSVADSAGQVGEGPDDGGPDDLGQHDAVPGRLRRVIGPDEMHADIDAAFESLLLGGYAIEAASIEADYAGKRDDGGGRHGSGELAVAIERDEASSLHLASEYVLALERSELRLSDFDMQLDSVRWSTVDTAAVTWGRGGITIEEVDLQSSAGGRIYVDGEVPVDGPVDLEVLVSELDIAHVADLLQDDREAAGIFELDARVQGTQQDPRIQGDAMLQGASLEGATVPDAQLDLSYEAEELHAVLDLVHEGRDVGRAEALLPLNLSLTGDRPGLLERPMRVTFRGERIPLGLLPALTEQVETVEGTVAADIAITGTPGEPSAEGDVTLGLESLHVVPLGIRFAPLTGHASLVDDVLRIDSVVAYSEGFARITGEVRLETLTNPSFDLELTARDAWVIDTEDARLQVDADLTVEGPLDTLVVSGLVRTQQGVIYVPEMSEFGSAEVVDLEDPATFERVDSLLVSQRDVVTGGTPALSRVQADLEVEIDRDVWLRSTEVNVEIYTPSELGPLRLGMRGLQGLPTIEGTINTDRGEYEYMSRRFTLTRGAVTFLGGDEIDPLLQIAAEHEVQIPGREALTIRILAGGSLREPQITFESNAQPPISETDLLSYLAFGREASALIQGGGASISGQASGSAGLVGNVAGLATQQFSAIALESMVSGLEADLGRELGLDVIRIAPAHLSSDVFTGSYLDVLRGTEIEVGRYLGSRMFIAAQARPARAFPGLRFEYRTRRDFEWSATWRSRFVPQVPTLRERQANSVGVFGSFLFKEWRF
jgi:translocation and assembly module TamB